MKKVPSEKYWPTHDVTNDNTWWDHAVLSDKNAAAAVEDGSAEYYSYKDEVRLMDGFNAEKGTDHKCTAKPADPTED